MRWEVSGLPLGTGGGGLASALPAAVPPSKPFLLLVCCPLRIALSMASWRRGAPSASSPSFSSSRSASLPASSSSRLSLPSPLIALVALLAGAVGASFAASHVRASAARRAAEELERAAAERLVIEAELKWKADREREVAAAAARAAAEEAAAEAARVSRAMRGGKRGCPLRRTPALCLLGWTCPSPRKGESMR